MGNLPNAQITEMGRMTKGVDEMIDENVLHWSSHTERMGCDRIAKWVYVGVYVGSCLVD